MRSPPELTRKASRTRRQGNHPRTPALTIKQHHEIQPLFNPTIRKVSQIPKRNWGVGRAKSLTWWTGATCAESRVLGRKARRLFWSATPMCMSTKQKGSTPSARTAAAPIKIKQARTLAAAAALSQSQSGRLPHAPGWIFIFLPPPASNEMGDVCKCSLVRLF
jgi:hypothetical protein